VDSLYAGQDVLITQSLSLKTKKLTEGLVRIRIQDVKKDDNLFHLIGFNRENLKGAQSFLALDGNNSLIFNKHIAKQDSLRIVYPHPAHDKLFVRFYRRQFPVAVPPFSIDQDNPFDYTADNYFEYPLENGSTPYIQLSDAGFYFFQADSSSRTGMTIYRYGPGFPELTTIEQIFEPLRYITTSREYDALENSPDLKMAIDSFWLEKSGNVNRARSQIAKYYNRVQEANQFFSSYLEGWKTDRGMIYIIFGPPNNVYRQTNTELWVYGEAGHNLSLRFSFVKVNNPFSDNDYSLYRNPMFKEAWYNAVENWRR
jgi:GWxTD domain-containing protein